MTRGWWVAALLVLTACRSGPAAAPTSDAPTPTARSFEELAAPCWPPDAPPKAAVTLILQTTEGGGRDFLTGLEGGAEDATAQCLRQVALEYPWPGGNPPKQLKLSADTAPSPSGWAVLEHVALLSTDEGPTRGIRDATPLVRACLDRGGPLRPGLVFRVATHPVSVSGQFFTAPGSTTTVQPAPLVSDVERCIQAVLSATAYPPGARTLLLDFARGQPGVPESPTDQVAWYFEPPGTAPASGTIDSVEAQAAITGIQPQVSACWDEVVARRGGVGGGRSLRMRVQPSGELQFVQVVADQSTGGAGEAVDYLLDRCLVREVHRVHLPRPEGGAADFVYSWVFAVREP